MCIMKFGIVDPRAARVEIVESPDLWDAAQTVGVISGQTDHGLIVRDASGGIGMFCYEFGLFIPPDEQRYFSVGRLLVAGAAVFYCFDAEGENVDLDEMPPIIFYRDAHQVERAIRADDIDRPQIAVNDVVYWRWPERTTDENIIARMRQHGTL
jgi:hypothetical protein